MKALLRKLIPRRVLSIYHLVLAYAAAFFYGFPSHKMAVIGITGTKGKSTTGYILAKILEDSGFKVGLTGTAIFKIAGTEWLNATKMTMLGRFALQRMLRDMVRAECAYAIVETSSEGLAQHRSAGIDYDVAVFTNLTPEHIESHGGFENYKKAKGKLFASLAKSARKKIGNGKKIIVANLDDSHADYFLSFWADEKLGFCLESRIKNQESSLIKILKGENLQIGSQGSKFTVDGAEVNLKLIGKANVMNALCALTAAASQGVPVLAAARAVEKIFLVPGRMEFIDEGQPFKIIVDYAHEPQSTRALYETVRLIPHKRIIQVFGSTGGGRDIARRSALGKLSGEFADIVIVTNDDPYDDSPAAIAEMVARGAREAGKHPEENLFIILDRQEAIWRAVQMAEPRDLVLITGKGSEQVMAVAGGRKIPWDDRTAAREAIKKLNLKI